MTTQHTPEPWHVGPAWLTGNSPICTIDHKEIADAIRDADARRIVACVNACAGIDTVGLENFAKGYPTAWDMVREANNQRDALVQRCSELLKDRDAFEAKLIAVEQQRDELLAAAIKSVKVAESWIHDQLDGTSSFNSAMGELDDVRQTIAKAQEGGK
jgi:hypothetical protein